MTGTASIPESRPHAENILLVSYYFPPINTAGIYRILGFVRHLPENGIHPILLTSDERNQREKQDDSLGKRVPDSLQIRRIGSWCLPVPEGMGVFGAIASRFVLLLDGIMPVDPFFLFPYAAARTARRIVAENRCRAIVTSSPPHSIHLLGHLVKKSSSVKWIADFRDPIKPRIIHRGFIERYLFGKLFFLDRLERLVIEHADIVIANTPTNRKDLERKYPGAAGRIVVIPNGYDDDDRVCDFGLREDSTSERLSICYAGEIYEGMGDTLWEAVRILLEEDPTLPEKLEINIAGLVTAGDLDKIRDPKFSGVVKYHGFLKFFDCQRMISRSDVALLLLPPGEFSYWIPSKIYTYFAMRKYVLGIVPQGDASSLIEEVNAGTWVSPDPVQVAAAIRRLIEANGKGGLGTEYNEEHLKRYTRSYQSKQLADVLRGALRSGAGTEITV